MRHWVVIVGLMSLPLGVGVTGAQELQVVTGQPTPDISVGTPAGTQQIEVQPSAGGAPAGGLQQTVDPQAQTPAPPATPPAAAPAPAAAPSAPPVVPLQQTVDPQPAAPGTLVQDAAPVGPETVNPQTTAPAEAVQPAVGGTPVDQQPQQGMPAPQVPADQPLPVTTPEPSLPHPVMTPEPQPDVVVHDEPDPRKIDMPQPSDWNESPPLQNGAGAEAVVGAGPSAEIQNGVDAAQGAQAPPAGTELASPTQERPDRRPVVKLGKVGPAYDLRVTAGPRGRGDAGDDESAKCVDGSAHYLLGGGATVCRGPKGWDVRLRLGVGLGVTAGYDGNARPDDAAVAIVGDAGYGVVLAGGGIKGRMPSDGEAEVTASMSVLLWKMGVVWGYEGLRGLGVLEAEPDDVRAARQSARQRRPRQPKAGVNASLDAEFRVVGGD